MTKSLSESSYRELFLWLLGRRKRLKVVGNSMLPLLQPGEEILIDLNAYRQIVPQVGDIVVTKYRDRLNLIIIKRITAVNEDGSCFLSGDNPSESTDSRHWGTVPVKDILGKVTSRFA
jgi:nickel-type superoxide dismutase maturation protease